MRFEEWRFDTRRSTLAILAVGALVLSATLPFITGYMAVATINLFLLWLGFTLRRRNKKAHALLIGSGILSDLILVAVLQFQRNAVQTAISFKLSAANQAHIGFSTLATLSYLPMIYLGIKLFIAAPGAPDTPTRRRHRSLGYLTLGLRTVGYFLMFSMLKNHPT